MCETISSPKPPDPLDYLQLIRNIAKRYVGRCGCLELDDLRQVGFIGLMEACQRYEPDKGAKFHTYAEYWIRNMILTEIADRGKLIRLPKHVIRAITANKKGNRLTSRQQGYLENGLRLKRLSAGEVSPFDYRGRSTPVEDDMFLPELLQRLSERERWLLERRFGLNGKKPTSFQGLANETGDRKSTLIKRQDRALKKLKAWLRA